MKIAIEVGWELVKWHLEGMYGMVEEGKDEDGIRTMRVSTSSTYSVPFNDPKFIY
jgi:hypothetical protein